jgi:regulator of protease activity HflC (stomatin/prohibitin superfamily)
MAEITKRAFARHLRATPTTYVQRLKDGSVKQDGVGIRFWFRPLNTEVSEVPVDEREIPLLFHGRTEDFQDVSVQATITYRLSDPARTVSRVDFSIDTTTGMWRSTPLDQLAGLLTELAQQHALGVLASLSLTTATVDGPLLLRQAITAGLAADPRLEETGIDIVGVRVVAVRPNKDLEQALQTPIAERLQQAADGARFERRANAVEQERAISENELQNEIELARRNEELVSQQGLNERKRMSERSEANRIKAEAEARDRRVASAAEADAIQIIGSATAEAERARLEAYAELGEATIVGLALKELAGNLPAIDTLVVAPDMLSSLAARLGLGAPGGEPAAASIGAGPGDAGDRGGPDEGRA